MFEKKPKPTQEEIEWAFRGKNFRVFRLHESTYERLDEILSEGWEIVGIDGNNWVQGIYLVKSKQPKTEGVK